MVVFVCKILIYEWCWFLLVIFVVGFVGLLQLLQVVLVLGIFGSVSVYIIGLIVDLWVGYFGM